MENVLNTRNDELVLLYINHALENLNHALICLQPNENDVMGDIEGAFSCINKSIVDNDWNNYLKNSNALTTQETIAMKNWFNQINDVIRFINQQATNNTQVVLQTSINRIVNNTTLLAVKDKLEKGAK